MNLVVWTIALFASAYSQITNRGQSCITPNNEHATCIAASSCKLIFEPLGTRDPMAIDFAKKSLCGYDTEPLFCCGSLAHLDPERFEKDRVSGNCGDHCEGGQPHCAEPCLNGDCTGPNTCTCKFGYIRDPASRSGNFCKPYCPEGCLNGFCTEPNSCTCKYGYIKDPASRSGNFCKPYCPEGCLNGFCTEPNSCTCKYGYIKVAKGSNKCVKRTRRSLHMELIPEQFD